jgi:hypothetical protein
LGDVASRQRLSTGAGSGLIHHAEKRSTLIYDCEATLSDGKPVEPALAKP